jgi:hypothetical protein
MYAASLGYFANWTDTPTLSLPGLLRMKSYLFMAYLALFQQSSWGNVGFFGIWRDRLVNSPIEWAVVPIALPLYLRRVAWKENPFAHPTLICWRHKPSFR